MQKAFQFDKDIHTTVVSYKREVRNSQVNKLLLHQHSNLFEPNYDLTFVSQVFLPAALECRYAAFSS
jgi:hypothetical protein